jgi:hypothetical protein
MTRIYVPDSGPDDSRAFANSDKPWRAGYSALTLARFREAGFEVYQLLHRTAAAVVEARRLKTHVAAMIVHSFSPTRMWFDAFSRFCNVWAAAQGPDRLLRIASCQTPRFVGWALGVQSFCEPVTAGGA